MIPFYIGRGTLQRAHSLFRKNTRHQLIVEEIKREGLTPIVEIIQQDLEEFESIDLEQWEISRYGRVDLGTGCLINSSDGGEWGSPMRGKKHSQETKRKISDSLKNNKRALGHKKSDETKEKIRRSMLKRLYGDKS